MGRSSTVALSGAIIALGAITPFLIRSAAGPAGRMSRFGEYRGYSEPSYDGYLRSSDYLSLADGTRLAYDLLLPTLYGVAANHPLPVLLIYTPYLRVVKVVDDGEVLGAELFGLSWFQRTFLWLRAKLFEDGHLLDQAFRVPWLGELIEHGYAVVAVERAGTGASFGFVDPSSEAAAREADEILDWVAAQPWSDGSIGMFGASYEAMMQYAAASSGNPHLKAILPCSSSFDFYDSLFYPGGVYNTRFASALSGATAVLETMAVPVDSDRDGTVLARVLEERRNLTIGRASTMAVEQARFRDSEVDLADLRRALDGPGASTTERSRRVKVWKEASLYRLLDRINESGVAVYNSGAWHDIFTRDMLLWHVNLEVPRRLHVRPLHHRDVCTSGPDLDFGAEARRWFDYWLKGVENGIMDEPPIRYYVMGAPEREAWRAAGTWPPVDRQVLRMYLVRGAGGSIPPEGDGALSSEPPGIPNASDTYTVDYSTTSGVNSRWNAVLGSGVYQDMRENDDKALTYSTAPLEADVEVTGHPVVHLWISAGVPDADLFVYLEEVRSNGRSSYVTEGNLRASHRALGVAPFDNLGLPFQRSYERDVAQIPDRTPVELVFDLQPTSKLFQKGNRIRIAITGADADNFRTPVRDPAPVFELLRSAAHASFVDLPTVAKGQ